MLTGTVETKVRPAVVIGSEAYLRERPDVLVGILTTKIPARLASTDYILRDWQAAGLRAESCFRVFVLTIHRSELTGVDRNWPPQPERLEQSAGLRATSLHRLSKAISRFARIQARVRGSSFWQSNRRVP